MSQPSAQPKPLLPLLASISVAFVLFAAVACQQLGQRATSDSPVAITSTGMPTTNPTDMAYMWRVSGLPTSQIEVLRTEDPTQYVELQTLAAGLEQRATMLAQTPASTSPPALTFTPTGPTPTMVMGMQRGCATANYHDYVTVSCWRGEFNGELISVAAAVQEYRSPGKGSDPVPDRDTWVVLVYKDQFLSPTGQKPEVYRVPKDIGPVRIASVDKTRFILSQTTYNGDAVLKEQALIFDLATRQFETVSGTPIPTTPVPTPSP